MKKKIQLDWSFHSYTIEINFKIPSVVLICDKRRWTMTELCMDHHRYTAVIPNEIEEIALHLFYEELEPRGIEPKQIKWFSRLITKREIYKAEVKLIPTLTLSFERDRDDRSKIDIEPVGTQ